MMCLRFPLADLETPPTSDRPYIKEKPPRRLLRYARHIMFWCSLSQTDRICSVEQPRPNLSMTVNDNAPALVGELYRLSVTLTGTTITAVLLPQAYAPSLFIALGELPVTGTLDCTVEMAVATPAATPDPAVLGEVIAGGLPLSSVRPPASCFTAQPLAYFCLSGSSRSR